MTRPVPVWLQTAAERLVRLPVLLRPRRGQHARYVPPDEPWEPATPDPEPAPVRQFRPRYVPDVKASSQLVREAYEILERHLASQLYAIAQWETFAHV